MSSVASAHKDKQPAQHKGFSLLSFAEALTFKAFSFPSSIISITNSPSRQNPHSTFCSKKRNYKKKLAASILIAASQPCLVDA